MTADGQDIRVVGARRIGLGAGGELRQSVVKAGSMILADRRDFVRGCLMCWAATACPEFELVSTADVRYPGQHETAEHAAIALLGAGGPILSNSWLHEQVAWLRGSRPELPIMLLVEDDYLGDAETLAVRLSLQGYIPTSSRTEVAAAVVRLMVAGGIYHPRARAGDPVAASQVVPAAPELPAGTAPRPAQMTPREVAVLTLLSRGLQNKIIAYQLGMSISTVKLHVHNIIRKLNVHNRTEVAVAARQMLSAADEVVAALPPPGPSLADRALF